jgi:hypothetical protein
VTVTKCDIVTTAVTVMTGWRGLQA